MWLRQEERMLLVKMMARYATLWNADDDDEIWFTEATPPM